MGLASKIIVGEKPKLRDYILPAIVLSTLCVGGAISIVEGNASREVYKSVKDLTYTVLSDPLSK